MAAKRKVQKNSNNQYTLTIPKAIAEALGYNQGTQVEIRLNEKGEIIIKKK